MNFYPFFKIRPLLLNILLLAAICGAGCHKLESDDYHDTPLSPKATRLMVILGSSTAQGDGANPIDSAWAYRLQSTVNKAQTKANLVNLAYGGLTTYEAMPSGDITAERPLPDTARNITKALSLKPSLVILSFPTNDIAANYSDDEILHNYAAITHLLDSAKVQYIIFSTQPRDFNDINQRLRLKTLNDKIISVYSYHVNNFLNQLSTPTYSIDSVYSAGDGIHVNNAGHAVIFNATMVQPLFVTWLNGAAAK